MLAAVGSFRDLPTGIMQEARRIRAAKSAVAEIARSFGVPCGSPTDPFPKPSISKTLF
jgi:hypothetical protein